MLFTAGTDTAWGPDVIADKALRGDIHTLYSDHAHWLLGWLRGRLGSTPDAADVVQDTYVRLMTSGRHPEPARRDESRAFLVQIAKGLVIDMHRRRRLEQAYLDALARLPEPEVPSQETRAILLETLVSIDAALDALPRRARTTFLLSRFDGLTYSEIATRQGIAVATVRKDMLRATQACLLALHSP